MTLQTTDRERLDAARLPLDALAAHLRLPAGWADIPGEAARLARHLEAAIAQVEARTGHAVLERLHTLSGRAPGGHALALALRPLTGLVMAEADGVALPAHGATLRVEGMRSVVTLRRPLVAGATVTITVRAGIRTWEAVPAALREAVLLAAEALEGERASPAQDLASRLLGAVPRDPAEGRPLSARRFRRHLVLEAAVSRPDGAGGVTRAWEARGAFWAEVRAGRGRVRVTELGADPDLRVRIRIRAVPPGHPARPAQGDHFLEPGRVYEVETVHEADAAGRYLDCDARELAGRAVR